MWRTAVVALLVLGQFAPAWPQSGAYDLRWLALCGPNGDQNDQNAASVHAGQLRVTVTQRTDSSGTTFWEMRNASTGQVIVPFANEPSGAQDFVLPLPSPPCVGGTYIGTFDWNSIGNTDAFKTFAIDGEAFQAGNAEVVHIFGIRATTTAPPPPTSRTVKFTNLVANQVVSGTYGVKMTASGLGAGSYKWFLSVDGAQISFRVESSTAITFFWNTGAHANGTHTFSARVVDAAGAEARGSVSVVVRN
jgi:hypothetical protein